MSKRLLICLLYLCPAMLFAQPRPHKDQLTVYQDSLASLGKKVINAEIDVERKNANYTFIKTLTSALKLPGSFSFKFDSVKSISIINAPDGRFRIFTWQVMNDDGSYRFYGTIQMNTGNAPLLMHPLNDYSPLMDSPEDTVTNNTKWYGALYYHIIPVGTTNPYYVLLGWKGNTVKSTKKVIEVLSFKNGKPVFGMPVFEGNNKTRNRVVFEYNRQVSMLLRYVPERGLIIYDHLAPPDKKMVGKMDTYGPDLTYDGYRLRNGVWQYQENMDMRNMPGATDADIDPKKQARQDKSAAGFH